MATPLTDYLKKMANDPKEQDAFQKDPDAHMQSAGLSPAHQSAIKSKDPKQIAAAVIGETNAKGTTAQPFFTWYIYIVIKF